MEPVDEGGYLRKCQPRRAPKVPGRQVQRTSQRTLLSVPTLCTLHFRRRRPDLQHHSAGQLNRGDNRAFYVPYLPRTWPAFSYRVHQAARKVQSRQNMMLCLLGLFSLDRATDSLPSFTSHEHTYLVIPSYFSLSTIQVIRDDSNCPGFGHAF